VWFEKNKNSLNLKFKHYNISCTSQTRKDFIHASEIHSELLFMHGSCYSDTRGVTLIHSHVASLLDGARLELRELKARFTLLGACTS
jgi:hypothetical protein